MAKMAAYEGIFSLFLYSVLKVGFPTIGIRVVEPFIMKINDKHTRLYVMPT